MRGFKSLSFRHIFLRRGDNIILLFFASIIGLWYVRKNCKESIYYKKLKYGFYLLLLLSLLLGDSSESPPEQKEDVSKSSMNTQKTTKVGSSEKQLHEEPNMRFGELLELKETNINDELICVVKAKIKHSYSNKSTIQQNAYNIENFIKENKTKNFDEIQYWAVMESEEGNQFKVISFDIDKSLIESVKNGKVPGNQILKYADNVWVHPGLLQ